MADIEIKNLSDVDKTEIVLSGLLNIPLIKGEKGDPGEPNILTIGNVSSGENPSAEIRGDTPNQILDLVLPKGDKGDPGETYNDTDIKNQIDLVADMIPTLESEEAENINVDSAKYYGQVKARGKSEQETIPSTEHPSEIKNLSGDIEITVCNKNFFNKNTAKQDYVLSATGQEVVSPGAFISDYILVKKGISYFSNTRGYSNAGFYDLDKNFIERKDLNQNVTLLFEEDCYIRLNGKTENINTFQFEIGTFATDCIEHEEQKITFPLSQGQKMYDGDYLADDGIHHVRKQDNNVSGTSKTFSNAKENGKYMCNVKESGTLNGKTITFETSVTNAIVEYELAEEETEAYTEAQQEAYDKLKKIMTYYPVTNVYSNQGAKLQLIYKMNLNSMFATVQKAIAEGGN